MSSPNVVVRPTTPSDIDSVLSLQDRVYPSIDPWHRDHLAHQLTVFPEGQLVAVSDDEIVGCASSLLIFR